MSILKGLADLTEFLDFFHVDSIEEFIETFGGISNQFMEHDGFLYNDGEVSAINKLRMNEKKLFHVKIKNQRDEIRNFWCEEEESYLPPCDADCQSCEDVGAIVISELYSIPPDERDYFLQVYK